MYVHVDAFSDVASDS